MSRWVIIIAMGILSSLFGGSSGSQPASAQSDPADVGRDVRRLTLSTPASQFGVTPTAEFPRVYALLMDWPVGDKVITVFSSSSGAASLYTTSTFGIIGGEGHHTVRAAAVRFVRAADRFFDLATPTAVFPYPDAGRVRFYLLTFEGVRVIDTDLASIENQASAHFDLFVLGQAVLTELRLVTESAE